MPLPRRHRALKSFGSNEVLKGIDFHVDDGQVVCVIRPSGSGKSTLLRCINLLERPDSGQVFVEGIDITDPETNLDAVRSRIGMVFQQFNLFPHMNVMRNLTVAQQKVAGRSKKAAVAIARANLEKVGWAAGRTSIRRTSRVGNSSAWRSRVPCRWTPT